MARLRRCLFELSSNSSRAMKCVFKLDSFKIWVSLSSSLNSLKMLFESSQAQLEFEFELSY
jgi:hypothetical protein